MKSYYMIFSSFIPFLHVYFFTSFCTEDDGDEKVYTKDMCEELSKHVMAVKHLPNQCMKFSDIVHSVEVNEKDSVHPSSFLS